MHGLGFRVQLTSFNRFSANTQPFLIIVRTLYSEQLLPLNLLLLSSCGTQTPLAVQSTSRSPTPHPSAPPYREPNSQPHSAPLTPTAHPKAHLHKLEHTLPVAVRGPVPGLFIAHNCVPFEQLQRRVSVFYALYVPEQLLPSLLSCKPGKSNGSSHMHAWMNEKTKAQMSA